MPVKELSTQPVTQPSDETILTAGYVIYRLDGMSLMLDATSYYTTHRTAQNTYAGRRVG